MEACALELATVNETVKKEMAAGITLQHAKKALEHNESVEDRVQACASDLHEANEVLAEEVDYYDKLNRDHDELSRKLFATQDTLINTQNVLAIAHGVAEEARQRALVDIATGIPNRELFDDHLAQALGLARRYDWMLAVMFIDLDGFKHINDTYGHTIGDKVLQIVAQRLDEQARTEDTVCRYGGDEFLYLLVNPRSINNIQRIAGASLSGFRKH
ncbi:MAG: GGDEF domain-containing protein [Nitrosospira sp.]|nr:GGDEF domain-containing protein [Nitrosospira sp.]